MKIVLTTVLSVEECVWRIDSYPRYQYLDIADKQYWTIEKKIGGTKFDIFTTSKKGFRSRAREIEHAPLRGKMQNESEKTKITLRFGMYYWEYILIPIYIAWTMFISYGFLYRGSLDSNLFAKMTIAFYLLILYLMVLWWRRIYRNNNKELLTAFLCKIFEAKLG